MVYHFVSIDEELNYFLIEQLEISIEYVVF